MSTLAHAATDSATMLRRDLRHALRYPAATITTSAVPIFMLLLFVYVFGGSMTLGGAHADTDYVDYVAPAIVLMTVGAGSLGTALNVNADMTEGIVNRFRTMGISRGAVLSGQVAGSVIRTAASVVLVIGVALLCGFRPTTDPLRWVAAAGVVLMLTLALTWMAVAMGMVAKTPVGANSATQPFQFGPFLSSAFVDPDTMPTGMRWFAEYQPFTPVIDTMRGLLTKTPVGDSAALAVAWCVALTGIGYLWARAAYERDPVR